MAIGRGRANDGSSGVRDKVDAVSALAADRGTSQTRKRPLFVLVLGVGDDEQDALGALGSRYEVRFVDTVDAAIEHIDLRTPDVLVLDDDADIDEPDAAGRDGAQLALLERLSLAFAAPVVIVLSSRVDRPSLARLFGVPSVRKPVSVEALQSAISVALEQNLRPVRRHGGE